MGGRMTSRAMATEPSAPVRGLIFLGFPLHPPAKPSTDRADHLRDVTVPMLFLQGDRDKLAGLELLRPVCADLGARAKLHIVTGGDHSFDVLKRSGRTADEAMTEIADVIDRWITDTVGA